MRFLLGLLLIATPIAAKKSSVPVVEVFVPTVSPPMDLAFYHAQAVATGIFSEIGVVVRWRLDRGQDSGCSKEPMRRTIRVAFSWNTPAEFHAGAFAIANPFASGGACVTVFMDRLNPMLAGSPIRTAHLLGHILAHEMGHVLQGIDRHSETGVLKPRWSHDEVTRMQNWPLRFTEHDAELILDGFRGGDDVSPHPQLVSMQ